MLPPKALAAVAAVVIASTFVALMIKSRGTVDAERDELDEYGEQQATLESTGECRDAVGHAVAAASDYLISRYGDGAPAGIGALAIHRCTFDQWSSEVLSCLARVTSDNELQRCVGKLPEHHRRALEAEMKAFALNPPKPPPDASIDADDADEAEDDAEDDWNAGGDPYSPDPVDPDGSGIPPACVEYEQTMQRMASCDKLPQASRDALKQGFDAMKSNWAQIGAMPKAARDAMESGCRQAVDALKQAGASICGW